MSSTIDATIQAGLLRRALNPVRTLVNEAVVDVDPDGLRMRRVGANKNTRVTLDLSATAFSDYDANTHTIGMNVSRLYRFSRILEPDTSLRLTRTKNSRRLRITAKQFGYLLSLLEPNAIERDISSIPDSPARAVLRCDDDRMRRLLTASGFCTNMVTLGIDPESDTYYGTAEGDDDAVYAEFPASYLIDLQAEPAYGTYPLKTLRPIHRSFPDDSRAVRFSMGRNEPLTLSTPLADNEGRVAVDILPITER